MRSHSSPIHSADSTAPGGLLRPDTPQFVAVTFDDGFGLENRGVGGVRDIIEYCRGRRNPDGAGDSSTFDASPIAVTLYLTSAYGEDRANLAAWRDACAHGHEIGNHSKSHPNGGTVAAGDYLPQFFDREGWRYEIDEATRWLSGRWGIGVRREDIVGFRAPFLSYNPALFAALAELGFKYDTSIFGSGARDEDGTNCRWPYRMAAGSPDADERRDRAGFPRLDSRRELWEVPVSTLFVPPDDCARAYGAAPGMSAKLRANLPYPSVTDAAAGSVAGLDYTLLVDCGFSPPEMAAILKHTLDRRLSGNRAPMVVAAHTFMYSFAPTGINTNTSSLVEREARWAALTDFMEFARAKPEVRLRAVKDIVSWMERPSPLGGPSGLVAK